MRVKTIKSVISKKMNEWFDSIENPTVKKLAKENTILTGGCIASMLLGESVNDYDVYFSNYETARAVANYYLDKFREQANNKVETIKLSLSEQEDLHGEPRIKIVIQSAGIRSEKEGTKPYKPYQYFEARSQEEAGAYIGEVMTDPDDIEETYETTEKKALEVEEEGKEKYRPVFLSSNAITLSNKIQVIIRFFGAPDDIHKYYDFVHCTNYWTSWDNNLVLRSEALSALLTKELLYVGSRYPVCSIFRLRKFLKRGFRVNAGQLLKICMQISELDLTDIKVLEDQLTGVDCAYFIEIIGKIKEKDPEKINYAYLVEIIDRMF